MTKIAVAQIESSTEKRKNLDTALALIKEARNNRARMIAFPEFMMAFSPAAQSAEEVTALAEPIDGSFVGTLQGSAKDAGVAVLATIYETSRVPDRVYDTALWIDADGNIATVYRKLHLYDAFGLKESDKFHPGEDITPAVACGDARCGLMICYDLRFPEMGRMLALGGADVLFAPSGWVRGDMKFDHWQTMIKARALENGCYVVAPDQTGNIYIGHSLVVDPMGRVIIDMGEKEGLQFVDLDIALVAESREKLPLLKNRRAEIYSRYLVGR